MRIASTRGGQTVLIGAQGGVYLVPEGRSVSEGRELRFPVRPRGQGGVNAAAYFDGYIYATHSELGVYRWDWDDLLEPERLYADVTGRHESTRGATISAAGHLYFASGPNVYQADLAHPDARVTTFRGVSDSSVTAFVLSKNELYAGTRAGRVLRWSLSDPGSPRELSVRKANPIYMLRMAELDGQPHLLVGAKEHGVTAVSVEDGRALDFRASDQIRWVDGATDMIYGVTRSGYAVHVWDTNRLQQVLFTIHLVDRVQDIFVAKEPVGVAV